MTRIATAYTIALLAVQARAALPTLSELAARLDAISTRYAETTNALTSVRVDLTKTRTYLATASATVSNLVALVEGRQDLREAYHGGRVGQYITTNDLQVLSFVAYADGTIHTNTPRRVSLVDPEAAAKAKAEAEARLAEWERANLPAEIADLLQRRRDAANGKAAGQ